MKKKLEVLYYYLEKNGYEDDARRVLDIAADIEKDNSENAKKRLIAMCSPRYLGDLNIKEFSSAYECWNFLEDISLKAKESLM